MLFFYYRSDSLFDWYIPGYNPSTPWSDQDNDIRNEYDPYAHANFIHQLEYTLPRYHYSGETELLLFDVKKGIINIDHYMLLLPETMELYGKKDFSILFEKIYHEIEYLSNDANLSKLKGRFLKKIVGQSLIDCLQVLLRKKILFKHLIKRSRSIYCV